MSGVTITQDADVSNNQQLIMANSASIDFMDPVAIVSGFLTRITASTPITGFFQAQTTAVASNNQTVGKVLGQYDGNYQTVVVNMNTLNAVAVVQANIGQFFNVNVTTGVITADTGTFGTTGQFECIDFDPQRIGATTVIVARVSLPAELSFAPHT